MSRNDSPSLRIINALGWAADMHRDQTYRGGSYLNKHLIPVYHVVDLFTGDKDVLIAAILHDIVEDTPVTVKEVRDRFGDRVADLVWRVTDEPGVNRKERKEKTYPKIKADKFATLIKLADRFVNMSGSTKIDMYRKEYPDFKAALYTPNNWDDLWASLDRMAEND